MKKINKLILILGVLPKLGLWNVFYMFYYRISLKLGWRTKRFNLMNPISGEFFTTSGMHRFRDEAQQYKEPILKKADEICLGWFTFYSYHKFKMDSIPNWTYDPFSEKTLNNNKKHWTEINEFDLNTGDIKNLWELSRFDWATDLARAYGVSKDAKYLDRLNLLINDWSKNNPTNLGVNWRCGQETTIRVMKLFNSSLILGSIFEISDPLKEMILQHLERIYNNINYAVAQNNNHGTSEAAGLYIGAVWLLSQEKNDSDFIDQQSELTKYKKEGRKILENRLEKLILQDGTFSQKSINYHRVVIDTLSFVLYGLRIFNEPELKPYLFPKMENLGQWLLQMISNEKGEVPNLGANDGARFENLNNNDYRDFRPSLQLYFALLKKQRIWDDSGVNEPLYWRGIDSKSLVLLEVTLKNHVLDNEFLQLTYKDIIIRVKATQNNFRPANDVLNIDVWYKGKNILIDTGSYSYNSELTPFFRSIRAHNSLQFGNTEPMPKISRFLNGAWVKVDGEKQIDETEKSLSWKGGYLDYNGNKHQREIVLNKQNRSIEIKDFFTSNVEGQDVKLHFHLCDNWENLISLECVENKRNITSQTNKAFHSLYYKDKKEHSHLTFVTNKKIGTFVTSIKFKT